jgi:hypothetical protein
MNDEPAHPLVCVLVISGVLFVSWWIIVAAIDAALRAMGVQI